MVSQSRFKSREKTQTDAVPAWFEPVRRRAVRDVYHAGSAGRADSGDVVLRFLASLVFMTGNCGGEAKKKKEQCSEWKRVGCSSIPASKWLCRTSLFPFESCWAAREERLQF